MSFLEKCKLFAEGFMEAWHESTDHSIRDEGDVVWDDEPLDNDDLLTGIPTPCDHLHINHEMYHPELYD